MTGRWHVLIAKSGPWSSRRGLTDWEFGALMIKMVEQYSTHDLRQPTYAEKRKFNDNALLDEFHWGVALDHNVGFDLKLLIASGIEFRFWTDKEMDPVAREVAANPKQYKHCMDVDLEGTEARYRFFRSHKIMPDGRKIVFPYSTQRNVAGYFVTWRQVVDPGNYFRTSARDKIVAYKLRRKATEVARTRASKP